MELEHLRGFLKLLLLQEQLGKRGNRSFALWVELEGFFAVLLRVRGVVVPLVESQTLVHEGKDVDRRWWDLGLLDLDGAVKLLQSVGISLRIQKQLAAEIERER